MIHHSHCVGVRAKSLLLLCGWLSVPLGVGALSLSQTQAYAVDLESSPALPATVPADLAITPAAPADSFIDPAPAEPIVEPAPAPITLPLSPPTAAPEPGSVGVSPQIMPQTAEAPATPAEQPAENAYIDPEPYDSGETASTPQSDKPVLLGSTSGCQANLNIDPVLAATLCGPSGVQTASQSEGYPTSGYSPAPASQPSYSAPSPSAPRWTAYAPTVAPTPWGKNAPVALNPFTSSSPSLQLLPPAPNPLKWLVPNQQRMIFPLPMPASITSAFGWRVHPISGESSFHAGTDLAAPMGTPVLAAFPGQVETAGFMGGYGLSILLQHQQGPTATRYAHLSKIYVQPGQWVSQGTLIGLVGSTGNSTGPHLHFETLEKTTDGLVAIDPGLQLKVSLADLIKVMQTAKVPPQPQS
ncbi:MAG: peptidoglycan DD-metalloendopeptidase family protein [Acaryochloris sp. RU_4_1]|nr:peptidoglycan DD-metalloendopeptidase family protein [Acaryochloris sp. RU_4_1]NJR54481.1 peptidoglycan DD-metalloendopeptidase family protein [Acaryochloris sp. CRU_2_0]